MLRIGVLKHSHIGEAERQLILQGRLRGHDVRVVSPTEIVADSRPEIDILIGRPELSSFNEAFFSLYLSAYATCELHGIPTLNPSRFMINGQDKFLSHLAVMKYLKSDRGRSEIPAFLPETHLFFEAESACGEAQRMLGQFGGGVLKDPHSGRGEGIHLFRTWYEFEHLVVQEWSEPRALILQQPLEKERSESGCYQDLRVWVCRDPVTNEPNVFGAYYREARPGEFLTNISRGGAVRILNDVDESIQQICRIVLDAVEGDVAGLDLVRDVTGRLWFLEVNVAFETGARSIEAMQGERFWARVIDLCEARWNRSLSVAQDSQYLHPSYELSPGLMRVGE